jgi:hypothetical protein
MTGYTILGFVRFGRDEILPPQFRGYRLLSLLPDWTWQTWLLIAVITLAAALMEGAYRKHTVQERTLREKHPVKLPSGKAYVGVVESPIERSWMLALVLTIAIVASWTHGRLWGKAVIPETELILSLEPAVNNSDLEITTPITSAMLRLQNTGDVIDHNVYIRLQAPSIQRAVIDQPERVHLIGGNKGWILNPTANLELLVPDLLPHEVRTIYVFVLDDPSRSRQWAAYMRSDKYPNAHDAVWPQINGFTHNGVDFMRFRITIGEEHGVPGAR